MSVSRDGKRVRLPVIDEGARPRPEMPAPAPAVDEPPVRNEDLPELGDAMVDPATLEQLFFDLEHATEIVSVTLKELGARRATAHAIPLQHARARLVAGDVDGIQIRYRYDGGEWWDTLMRVGGGIRLIRIRHDV